jgi:isoleucyl-tRNA synthetase
MLRNLKNFNPPEIEEKVLKLWKEKNIFQKTLKPKKGKKEKIFRFWEGPPTANGRPGIHHVLARSFKDVILRFKTMQGYVVPRKGGWDTHGLPVEIQVEKQLGFKTKKDIENYSVAAFNQKCKESVWVYQSEWEKLTERMGYWLDLKNAYVTYHKDYMESLWWIIKQAWDKGLMYQGHKVVPWCTRCGTSLSSHEMGQPGGYKEVTDTSVFIKFKLLINQKINSFKTDASTYVLSWTTTPWTLPGNIALAVGDNIDYVALEQKDGQTFIVARDLAETVLGAEKGKEVAKMKGKDLVGLSYKPLFEIKLLNSPKAYKIYPADFVTTTDGTGVVHTAVMYGEDDYNLGKKIGLPEYHTVTEQGVFTKEVAGLENLYVKDKETESKILDYLEEKGFLLKTLDYTHEYPFCWRCGTALIYYARSSWFIEMSKLKKKLISSNEKTNWVPEHIKHGRFGEWLEEVKDWNFSRDRFWGTPLPIWKCDKCDFAKAIGSFKDFDDILPSGTNKYILLRHGEGMQNVSNTINGNPKNKDEFALTPKGKTQAQKVGLKLGKLKPKIDLIIASDFRRTKETAEIVAKQLGIEKINFNKNLREIYTGTFDGTDVKNYHQFYSSLEEKFMKAAPQGENLRDVALRQYEFVKECEEKYKNKTILVVGHEYPLWMLKTVLSGWSQEESTKIKEERGEDFIAPAEFEEASLKPASRDDKGICDYHKPYVDLITFPCEKCKGTMRRVKEVADVWFDSGSMPFAQDHFPFTEEDRSGKYQTNSKAIKNPEQFITYPADYICEAVDQTRGWFYTLLATSTILGYDVPFKNVVCLGHINDKYGQKMSKSKGNIVDPWTVINKYGIDAIRWYFYTVNAPGESKNFDELEIAKVLRRLMMTIYNSFVFLNLYGKNKCKIDLAPKSKNILDVWIIQRTKGCADRVKEEMERYNFIEAGQIIESYVDELSRWYIRRSRRRFQKVEDKKDWEQASAVLAYVLLQLSKIMAPFTPFFSEALYQSLASLESFDSEESVHLESWPEIKITKTDPLMENLMSQIRAIASSVLAKRAEVGIKVRQPLGKLRVKGPGFRGKYMDELFNVLKDEINVKEIVIDSKIENDFELDINITPELKVEGTIRELARMIQDLRQGAGCVPKEKINIWISTTAEIEAVIRSSIKQLAKDVGAENISISRSDKFDAEAESKIDGSKIWIGIKKVK